MCAKSEFKRHSLLWSMCGTGSERRSRPRECHAYASVIDTNTVSEECHVIGIAGDHSGGWYACETSSQVPLVAMGSYVANFLSMMVDVSKIHVRDKLSRKGTVPWIWRVIFESKKNQSSNTFEKLRPAHS